MLLTDILLDSNPNPKDPGCAVNQSEHSLAACTQLRPPHFGRNFERAYGTRPLSTKLPSTSHVYLTTNQCSMAVDDYTDSSLTSEPDNLTELHRISGLPTEHQSRTTKTGFVIRQGRLPNCVPLPANNVLPRSWIWLHGEPIGVLNKQNEVIKHWLCRECY